MELSKYYQSQRRTTGDSTFERMIDDAFGHLEQRELPPESIRAILGGPPESAPKPPPSHTDLLADTFIGRAEPGTLRQMLENGQTQVPLEDLPPPPLQGDTTAMAHLQAFIAASPGMIHILQNRKIPATLPNLRALEKTARPRSALSELFEDTDVEDGMDLLNFIGMRKDAASYGYQS
jgi:hypothetical protein